MVKQSDGEVDRGVAPDMVSVKKNKQQNKKNTEAVLKYLLFLFFIKGLAKMERSTHC